MKLLDRNELLKKEELQVVEVDLGKGESVHVRQMTGHEREAFERMLTKKVKKPGNKYDYEESLGDFRAKLAVCTICNKEGELVLQMGDFTTLSHNMSAARLTKIADEAGKLNGITPEDKEELVKNSDSDQDVASSSDSAKN